MGRLRSKVQSLEAGRAIPALCVAADPYPGVRGIQKGADTVTYRAMCLAHGVSRHKDHLQLVAKDPLQLVDPTISPYECKPGHECTQRLCAKHKILRYMTSTEFVDGEWRCTDRKPCLSTPPPAKAPGPKDWCALHHVVRSRSDMKTGDGGVTWVCKAGTPSECNMRLCVTHGRQRHLKQLMRDEISDGWRCTRQSPCHSKKGYMETGDDLLSPSDAHCSKHLMIRKKQDMVFDKITMRWACSPGSKPCFLLSHERYQFEVCLLHGVRRAVTKMSRTPEGRWCCQEGDACDPSNRSELCFSHKKMRHVSRLVRGADGAYQCRKGDSCIEKKR